MADKKKQTLGRKDRSGKPDEDNWQTPQWLYDQLDAEFKFDFDPCPNYAKFDGLAVETKWGKSNFINPPYNRVDKPRFIQRAYDEWRNGNTCVLLIPAATGTKQFHELILPHAEIRFLKGRVAFVEGGKPRDSKATAKGKHDTMVVIFRAGVYKDARMEAIIKAPKQTDMWGEEVEEEDDPLS